MGAYLERRSGSWERRLFNFVEGIIDHHILHVHHVTEDAGHLAWDLGFLGSGIVLIALGLMIIRTAKEGPLTKSSRIRRAE